MNFAVILAGGNGIRMEGYPVPKQFINLGTRPIIIHTLEKFEYNINIDRILIVMNPDWVEYTTIILKNYNFNKIDTIIEGGKTRQQSSYNALKFYEKILKPNDIILLHDAVRPFVDSRIINDCIDCAKEYGAADTAVKTNDTIVSVDNGFISEMPDRKMLYNGQTPQAFKYSVIYQAHKIAVCDNFTNTTDDVRLVLRTGNKVKIVNGDYNNIKITTNSDLDFAKKMLDGDDAK